MHLHQRQKLRRRELPGKTIPKSSEINWHVVELLCKESSFWKCTMNLELNRLIFSKIILRTARQNVLRHQHLWADPVHDP